MRYRGQAEWEYQYIIDTTYVHRILHCSSVAWITNVAQLLQAELPEQIVSQLTRVLQETSSSQTVASPLPLGTSQEGQLMAP